MHASYFQPRGRQIFDKTRGVIRLDVYKFTDKPFVFAAFAFADHRFEFVVRPRFVLFLAGIVYYIRHFVDFDVDVHMHIGILLFRFRYDEFFFGIFKNFIYREPVFFPYAFSP